MKVIICGAGLVGQGIAARLAQEKHVVTVVDVSASLINAITTELDVQGIVGHGAHPDILERAGAEDADMMIAVTYSDEVNMIACQLAHSLFSIPKKIARVRDQSYLESKWNDLFSRENMPIDIIISPEIELGRTILHRLTIPGAFEVVSFGRGRVQMLGINITQENAIINTPIGQFPELFLDLHAVVVGVHRAGVTFAPNRDDPLLAGDRAYFIIRTDQAHRLLEIMGIEREKMRHIVIFGCGNIGTYVAQNLEANKHLRCRVVEKDSARAARAAERLKKTVILNGDAMSAAIQEEAGVEHAEIVLCLTNDDKINLLSGVLAKNLGAKYSCSLINDQALQTLQQALQIDMIIDPRVTTVSSVLRHIRQGRILNILPIEQGAAEVIEGLVLETSPILGETIQSIQTNTGIVVGVVMRGENVLFPAPELQIKSDDHLVLLAEAGVSKNIEHLFRVSTDYF